MTIVGTTVVGGALVGREAELDALASFLDDRQSLPAALVIEGPAGAGKTTLWRAAIERAAAAGDLVLACRPAGAEVRLSLAALSDLLEPHLGTVLPELPPPQRRALEVALLLRDDDGHPPDQRAIAAGVVNALRSLARTHPVLIAIDDVQWLDAATAEVIEYALRRLGTAAVRLIVARRVESAVARVPTAGRGPHLEAALDRPTTRIDVGPLTLGALHRLLRTRTSLALNRRTLQRIHETSGGNPFYALELAGAIEREQQAGAPARAEIAQIGEPLPLSSGLNDLLADRLAGLADSTRDALFVAAAVSQPTIGLLEAVLGAPAGPAIRSAVESSIVRLDGDAIEFVHPLLAAAAFATHGPEARRAWHGRIAEAASDPETRARHLALARLGRDLDVASLLHAAAQHARDRGARAAAAELFAEAIERLPTDAIAERGRWIVEAAPALRLAGEANRAKAMLEAAIAELPPGPLRADALLLLAYLVEGDPGGASRERALLGQALAESGDDPRRKAAALMDLEMWERMRDRVPTALEIARQALALAEQTDDLALLANAHTKTADLEVLLGMGGEPVARFQRALELDKLVQVDAELSAPAMLAVCLIRVGRLDEARPLLLEQRRRAIAEGDEASHHQLCLCLTELEWLSGDWDAAASYAAEGLEVAELAGLRMREGSILGMVALVEASRGDPDRARTLAVTARAVCDEVAEVGYANYARQVLAFLELSLGNAAAAHAHLETYAIGRGIEGPKRIAFIGDEIEALVMLGGIDRAAELTDEVARRGDEIHRPPLTATAARCRALVLAARGDLDAAIPSAAEAVAAFEELGLPFERGRSLLVLGEVQRRAKQRRAARDTLDAAAKAFERLGARLWATRAKAETARVGGRSTVEGLTETELRVAQLAAEGRSNKEVAAALFVSVRAVEANLTKVYAKLGIRSRTELARRV